jgi:uncharacterized protein
MALTGRPEFVDLPRDEAEALLARQHVGRLAYSFRDRVDIEPISYVFSSNSIYCRTSEGMKLALVRHHPWVAFEVDEVNGPFDWRSVVARGTLYLLTPTGGDRDREAYEQAVAALRTLDPDALTPGDAVPHRTVVIRIYVDEMTGRAARTV